MGAAERYTKVVHTEKCLAFCEERLGPRMPEAAKEIITPALLYALNGHNKAEVFTDENQNEEPRTEVMMLTGLYTLLYTAIGTDEMERAFELIRPLYQQAM